MSNLNAQLAGANLQLIDNVASIQRVNSPIATIVAQTAAAFYDPYFFVPTGATALNLPGSPCWVLSIKNLSGSNTVSVTVTPQGGSAWASPYVIAPNGIFLTMVTYATAPSAGGFTAVSVLSSAGGTYAEIYMSA